MRNRALPFILLLGFSLAACAGGTRLARKDITDPGQLLFNGWVKEDVDCYSCHNGDGSGSDKGPDLIELVPTLDDDHLMQVMREGPGFMPDFEEDLTDEERRQILDWMRGTFGAGTNTSTAS